MSGKQRDLSTEWTPWVWSDTLGCKYSTRYGPTGEVEYDYLEPPDTKIDIPQYTGEVEYDYLDSPDETETPRYGGETHRGSPERSATRLDSQEAYNTSISPDIARSSQKANTDHESELDQSTNEAYNGFQVISKPTRFFKTGRVFKTLWTEPAGHNSTSESPNTSALVSGGTMFSKLRIFVVIREMKGCSICLSLFTYHGQGTAKKGVQSDDYAAVYASDNTVQLQPAETLIKEPFPIIVENVSESIHPMSRLNFGRIYTVEHNVKVLKIGRIPDEHHARLTSYLNQTIFGTQSTDISASEVPSQRLSYIGLRSLAAGGQTGNSSSGSILTSQFESLTFGSPVLEDNLPVVSVQAPGGRTHLATQITRSLDSDAFNDRFVEIDQRRNKKFWKPGRVFMMQWTEPARGPLRKPKSDSTIGSQYDTVWLGSTVYSEIRRFVVIGEGYGNVICSPIHTYSGQATLKRNLPDPLQHAIIHTSPNAPEELWEENEFGEIMSENLTKDPIKVQSELAGPDGDLGDLSRINYAKIYTVEKYVRVLNIGKVHENSMEALLASCFFARPPEQPPQGPRRTSHSNKARDSHDRRADNSGKRADTLEKRDDYRERKEDHDRRDDRGQSSRALGRRGRR